MNHIRISRNNLLFNYEYIQHLVGHDAVFPVLKSNAYGHGLEEVGKILNDTRAPYLAVDSRPEALRLMKVTSKPFLLLGQTYAANYACMDLRRVTPCVYSLDVIQALLDMQTPVRIHLFLNTGMNREGIQKQELDAIIELIARHPSKHLLTIEGVMSHLHSADLADQTYIDQQIAVYKYMYHRLIDAGHIPLYKHIGQTRGTLKIDDPFFNARRLGGGLYGINILSPDDEYYDIASKLRPVLSYTSSVVNIQSVSAGSFTGYAQKRQATDDCTVATIPCGYYEGVPRSGSNVLIVGHRLGELRQIGTICMNLTTLLIPEGLSVQTGDEIVIYSDDPDSPYTVVRQAARCGVRPYEMLIHLDPGMRREVV